jgi:DNA-binding transcriptional regulator YiaG
MCPWVWQTLGHIGSTCGYTRALIYQYSMADELKNQPSLGDIRRRANVTQRKLADKLNVTVKTVSAWECGEHEPRLTPQQLALLLETLNCLP